MSRLTIKRRFSARDQIYTPILGFCHMIMLNYLTDIFIWTLSYRSVKQRQNCVNLIIDLLTLHGVIQVPPNISQFSLISPWFFFVFDESVRSPVVLQGLDHKNKLLHSVISVIKKIQKLSWLGYCVISLTKGQDFQIHDGYLYIYQAMPN